MSKLVAPVALPLSLLALACGTAPQVTRPESPRHSVEQRTPKTPETPVVSLGDPEAPTTPGGDPSPKKCEAKLAALDAENRALIEEKERFLSRLKEEQAKTEALLEKPRAGSPRPPSAPPCHCAPDDPLCSCL